MTLRPRRFLLIGIAALSLAHFVALGLDVALGFEGKGTLRVFDLAGEQSFGTWLSALLHLVNAVLAASLALTSPARSRLRRGWWAVAGVLLLLSLDEVAAVHELADGILHEGRELPGFLWFAWVVPALIAVVAFVLFQWRFLASLPRLLLRRLVFAGSLFVIGAVGLEVIESLIYTAGGRRTGAWPPELLLVAGVEETLEMAASALVLLAFLDHLAGQAPAWTALVERGTASGASPHVAVVPGRLRSVAAPAAAEDDAGRFRQAGDGRARANGSADEPQSAEVR